MCRRGRVAGGRLSSAAQRCPQCCHSSPGDSPRSFRAPHSAAGDATDVRPVGTREWLSSHQFDKTRLSEFVMVDPKDKSQTAEPKSQNHTGKNGPPTAPPHDEYIIL